MALDPVTAIANAAGKGLEIIDQLVVDKDLAARLKVEITQLNAQTSLAIVQTQTTPKTDAFVKILYAMKDVGISMFRPTISAASLGFAAYATTKGIDLPEWLNAVMAALFPGWIYSRHVEKRDQKKAEVAEKKIEAQKEVASSGHPFPFLN